MIYLSFCASKPELLAVRRDPEIFPYSSSAGEAVVIATRTTVSTRKAVYILLPWNERRALRALKRRNRDMHS